MLYRPVYLKGQKMQEAPIRMAPAKKPEKPPQQPPPPPPSPPTPPIQERRILDIPPEDAHLPMLISNLGFTAVFPKEATRDVITGKVAYILVDEKGITKFTPKHALSVMKLNRKALDKYEDYPIIGGHERVLEKTSGRRIRYKRRFIDMDVIKKGIFGSKDNRP